MFFLFKTTEFKVRNVQVSAGYVLHFGVVEGILKVGDQVKCALDEVRFAWLDLFD